MFKTNQIPWLKDSLERSIRPEMLQVRKTLLQRMLFLCLFPGVFILIPVVVMLYRENHWGYLILFGINYLVIVLGILYANRISFNIKAGALVAVLFIYSVAGLTRIGLSGIGLEMMILSCFVAAMLFNIRAAIVMVAIGSGTMAVIGFGMVKGIIAVDPELLQSSLSFLPWIMGLVLFFLTCLAVILSPQLLRNRLEESLDLAEKQSVNLQYSNEQLNSEIDRREQAELEQTRLWHLLIDIIDSMPSMLVAVNADLHVTLWNQRVEQIMQIPAASAIGKPFVDLFPNMASQLPTIIRSIENGQPATIERLPLHFSQQPQFFDCLIYPISSNGIGGAVTRLDDITERVLMEETLIQSEKMASVGGLAAGMAHEINNPLGGILQGIQNIERRLSPGMKANRESADKLNLNLDQLQKYLDDRKILEYIRGIKESGMRASKIISNMLLFSRKSESKFTEVSLHQLLDKTIELASADYNLKENFDFKHIELTREYDPKLEMQWCTQTEMEQVILNLLKNAAQAFVIAEEKYIPKIIVRTRKEEKHNVIEIEDNGPGIKEEDRAHIFEPFFTTKQVGQGTGLGLSVSYMIVTSNHKGSLEVQSTPGMGTRFIIRLPVKPILYG